MLYRNESLNCQVGTLNLFSMKLSCTIDVVLLCTKVLRSLWGQDALEWEKGLQLSSIKSVALPRIRPLFRNSYFSRRTLCSRLDSTVIWTVYRDPHETFHTVTSTCPLPSPRNPENHEKNRQGRSKMSLYETTTKTYNNFLNVESYLTYRKKTGGI